MDGTTNKAATTRTAWALLLAIFSILALGGCGGGGGGGQEEKGGGGGETSAEQTAGGETTAAGGGETTAAAAGGETTIAAGGETTVAAGERTTPPELAVTAVELTPSRDSGASGTVNLTDTPGGVEAALSVRNLPTQPGTQHIAHIHEGGTCADDRAGNGAPVVYPLDPLITGQDGTSLSATAIDGVTIGDLTSGAPKYVNVHAEAAAEGEVPPGIACADIPGTGGEGTTAEGTTAEGY